GRTFRSRSLDNVLDELSYQSERHETRLFVFSDLKLNSNLKVWHGLLQRLPLVLPQAQWTASVHVGSRGANGLEREELRAARAAGLRRVTTGLESGSQRLLDA